MFEPEDSLAKRVAAFFGQPPSPQIYDAAPDFRLKAVELVASLSGLLRCSNGARGQWKSVRIRCYCALGTPPKGWFPLAPHKGHLWELSCPKLQTRHLGMARVSFPLVESAFGLICLTISTIGLL